MRIAIVSDIHGNLTALEAVIVDLRKISPDQILHGGDLAHGGSSPELVVDRIRELGWPGVLGNTDEMLFAPEKLTQFAAQSAASYQPLFAAIREIAAATQTMLSEDRLAWLRELPSTRTFETFALVHAKPRDLWRAPSPEAGDEEIESAYRPLGRTRAVYAHIHRSFVRRTTAMTIANTGSVSLSYDGDPRASYLVLDDEDVFVRRVEYDVAKEVEQLCSSGLPHAEWIARSLKNATFEMP